jgi:hypothetical protein
LFGRFGLFRCFGTFNSEPPLLFLGGFGLVGRLDLCGFRRELVAVRFGKRGEEP